MDLRSDDEAWLSAEAMERCGQLLRSPATKSSAQLAFAQLSRNRVTDGVKTSQPERHLAQAVAELGDEPARFLRSLIEWESSLLLRAQNRLEPALQHLRRARALSQELDDGAGVAAADLEHAAVLLDMNRPDEMLPLLDEAERLLVVGGEGDGAFRMPRLMELRVRALTRLRSPDLPAVLTQADRWIDTKTPSRHQAELENAMAEALAAIGRPGSAYEMLRRSMKTDQQMRGLARDSEMQHLQVRYELARRDAENTQLRMNSESARLQLEADRGRLQTLTAGLVALGALSVLGFSVASRELTRRRRLADLAMRDELTGQPNRRAVQAYAREQLAQAERLGLPFTLAVVDLDHFKQVNDRFGHAAGDAVLRAFAQVAGAVMRGQDRFGRWGGEEWLLVMPGTRLEEAASVFERLRERFAATPMPGAPADARCTFSMGAAELEPGVASVEALVAAADAALYRAKESGRNRLATSPLAVAAA